MSAQGKPSGRAAELSPTRLWLCALLTGAVVMMGAVWLDGSERPVAAAPSVPLKARAVSPPVYLEATLGEAPRLPSPPQSIVAPALTGAPTVASEVARLRELIGQPRSLQRFLQRYGEPDRVKPGNPVYRQEFLYEKFSPKLTVLVFDMPDGSVIVNYREKP